MTCPLFATLWTLALLPLLGLGWWLGWEAGRMKKGH